MDNVTRKVVYAKAYLINLESIYHYGNATFGFNASKLFIEKLYLKTENLSISYRSYPECRSIRTKDKAYRTMIYNSYLIIYRITKSRIEVLSVLHSSRSIQNIKSVKRISL